MSWNQTCDCDTPGGAGSDIPDRTPIDISCVVRMVCWSYDVCCLGMLLVCSKVVAGALFCFWSVYHRHLFSLRICHGSRAIRFSWFVSCILWEHSSVWSRLLMAAFLQANKACGNGSKNKTQTPKTVTDKPQNQKEIHYNLQNCNETDRASRSSYCGWASKFLQKRSSFLTKLIVLWLETMFEYGAISKSCGMGWFISICTKGDGAGLWQRNTNARNKTKTQDRTANEWLKQAPLQNAW